MHAAAIVGPPPPDHRMNTQPSADGEHRTSPPSQQKADLRRNVIAILVDISGFGMSLGFLGFDTLLPILAFTLTGDKSLVGLIGTLWVGMWLLPQLVAGRWMSRRARKKPVMTGAAFVSRAGVVLLAAVLALSASIPAAAMYLILVAAVSLFRSLDAVAAVAWLDILTKALPMRVRSQVFGLGQALSNALRFGASLVVAAAIASRLQYPDSYALLYSLAGLSLAIGWLGLKAIREPVEDLPNPVAGRMGIISHIWHVVRGDARFRQITIARLVLGLFDLARSQYAVHATVELGLPDSSIGPFSVAQTVGAVAASILLGRMSERRGSRAVIRVTTFLAAAIPLLALALHVVGRQTPGLATAGYLLLYAMLGAIDASGLLGILAYILDIAPPGERTAYTGLANTIVGVVVIMPAIGGIILQLTSYPVLFLCAAMGGILASVLIRTLPAATVDGR